MGTMKHGENVSELIFYSYLDWSVFFMTNRNNNYNNESIKNNVLGMAGNLAIATNAGWNSEYVVVYTIPNKDWKSDDDFKNLVFGRVSTNNAFKADKLAVVNLSKLSISNHFLSNTCLRIVD